MSAIKLVQYRGFKPDTTISPPCGKVHMALRFKGLEYDIHNVASPGEVKKFNARGRMPALIIDGETIVDSTDIVDALEARFPDPPLEPADPVARARVKILEDWADEVLYFYGVYQRWCVDDHFERLRRDFLGQMKAPLRWFVPALVRRDFRARANKQGVGLKGEAVARRELDECLDAVEVLLQAGSYVAGEQMTRADLAIACIVDQLMLARLHPQLAADVGGRRTLMEWLGRVHERAPGAA
jgi:glutathione S-transferase